MKFTIPRILHSSVLTGMVMQLLAINSSNSQNFYFGTDLSYVNEMEDCGALYSVEGVARDPYFIFSEHGANLVRLRLWHSPSWYDILNNGIRYSDFADVRQSIIRAKELNLDVLLDFHLSDNWADPAHQVAPAAWTGVLADLPVLQDSLYNYVYSTLLKLADEDLLPAIVQIGNETNKGILQSQAQNDAGWWLDWPRNAALFTTAIAAVRDVESVTSESIKIALHIAGPSDIEWFIGQFWMHGVQDFDIIGLSYYGSFHPVSIAFTGDVIHDLVSDYPGKEVMILETAYPWTTAGNDNANNVLQGVSGYPPSPANQKQWMIDLTQTVIDNGGSGVVYWEPAWVSTTCSTQWAEGSHWENATFFDFNHNLHADGGMAWMSYAYEFPTAVSDLIVADSPFEIYNDAKTIHINHVDDFNIDAPLRMDIWSVDGKAEWSEELRWDGKKSTITFDDIAPGMYIVSIYTRYALYNIQKIVVAE